MSANIFWLTSVGKIRSGSFAFSLGLGRNVERFGGDGELGRLPREGDDGRVRAGVFGVVTLEVLAGRGRTWARYARR